MSAKHVYMFCKKCFCQIDTVKHLKSHVPDCTGLFNEEHQSSAIPHLQIQQLKEELKIERLKSLMAFKILNEKIGVNIDSQELTPPEIETPPQSPNIGKKKERFSQIKNLPQTTESAIEEKRQKIAVELETPSIEDKDSIIKKIELEFSKLQVDCYPTIFRNILKYREKLLCVINPSEYNDMLKSYLIRISEYLIKNVKLNAVKIKRELVKYFNSIECRLLELDNFYKFAPNLEDIQWYNKSLSISKLNVAEFLPYNREKVFQRMLNYSVCTSPLLEIVRRELLNEKGFNNFIYLQLDNRTDKFSFYYLSGVDIKSRQWRLDCRLEEFAGDLVDNILDYCCELFRKYYAKIYGDNEYRENYWEKCEFMQYDQEQLINNIILLINKPKLMKYLQNLISEVSEYTPSDHDKFNLRSDDRLQLKRLNEEKKIDWGDKIVYHLHQLFDNMEVENDNFSAYILKKL